jgi:hypothetical protein
VTSGARVGQPGLVRPAGRLLRRAGAAPPAA